jgi:hypothetical protein
VLVPTSSIQRPKKGQSSIQRSFVKPK